MKKLIFLLFVTSALMRITVQGQSLSVSFPDTIAWGPAIDSTTLSMWINDNVTNNTANPVTVDVIRVQDATGTPGWSSEFCFQFCSQSWVDSIRTTMQPYEVVNIAVHINVTGIPDSGSVLMMYRNVNDTSEVYYQRFYAFTSPVSIEPQSTENTAFDICPNPVTDFTMLKFQNSLDNASIFIFNGCGQTMRQIDYVHGNSVSIDRGKLKAGIYFIIVEQNGQRATARKLIITD